MKQNITLSLDKTLIQKAKILAASRNTSISKMIADELTRLVETAQNYDRARCKALSFLETGFQLGGRPADREALHDRDHLR
ncbi:MAG: DUF6364 family protein [Desulfobacteraceae bacterium]|jgi:hypothetical protein|nr:DUF6364 family protein [Desulfobacteraceae bacterium]